MSSLPQGPMEVVQAFFKAAVYDRDEAAAKALLTKKSLEGGKFSPPPDASEMEIVFGEATEENGEWTVPVTISNPKDPSQPTMTMPFAPVIEDGQWKLDMDKMMERAFGGNIEAVMDGMVDALKGVGEAMAEGMKSAFEGLGDALGGFESSASNAQLNRLSDDASPEMRQVFDQFNEQDLPDQLALMREAIGSELGFYVDWFTFDNEAKAAKKLSRKVLDNLRSAVCLSSSDDKVRDGMREQLREVVVSHVPYPEGKSIRFEGGRLQITVNLSDIGASAGHYSSSDIMAAIREGLDADKGPAVDHLLTEVVPQVRDQLREYLDLDLELDINLASFIDGFDTDTGIANLKRLEDEVFRNFVYFVREAKERVPMHNLHGFRFEHVAGAALRALVPLGGRIIYRMCFTENDGWFTGAEFEHLLPGVISSLPDYSDPDTPISDSDERPPVENLTPFEIITRYRDRNFGDLAGNLQQAVGKQLHIDVDWASLGDDGWVAQQLKVWGLNRIVGAVRFAALNDEARQDMEDTLTGFMLVNVASAAEKRIEITAGMVRVFVCLQYGEQGCFYEREIAQKLIESMGSEFKPKIKDIREAAQYWEKELRENPEYGATVTYYIDFAGFTSSPEDQKNKFALTLLKEHGIDALYYAVTGLFESNPNFKQQFIERVHRFVIHHASEPSAKNVHGYGDAIVYELFLHEGYKGYLTIDELKKKLPKIVAEMPAPAAVIDAAASEPHVSYGVPEPDDDDGELQEFRGLVRADGERIAAEQAEPAAASSSGGDSDQAEAFAEVRSQIEATLPTFSAQFEAFLGKPIVMEIDWDSLEGDAVAMGQLLNICLAPLLGGLMTLGQNTAYRDDLATYIDRIVMRRVQTPEEQTIKLDGGELLMAVCVQGDDVPVLPAAEAASIFKGMIDHIRAANVTPGKPKRGAKEKAAAKSKPVPPAKKPALPAKKPAAKPPVKKVEKPKPKGKGDEKGKGKGKK